VNWNRIAAVVTLILVSAKPEGSVAIDPAGNLYSTTSDGGEYGKGVVWEISP
jgi:hypothetical protein